MRILVLFAILLAGLAAACSLPVSQPPAPSAPPSTSLPAATPLPSMPADLPPSGATAEWTPTGTATPTLIPAPTPIPGVRIAAGERALFLGDWETALAEYQTALASSADSETCAAALLGIGKAYYFASNGSAALEPLREILTLQPAPAVLPEAYFFLGEVYEQLQRYVEAADAYVNYLALRPGVLDSYVFERRGDALFAAGDYPAALVDYQAAWKSPRLGDLLTLETKMARVYAITGDYGTAQVMYQDIYQRAESDYLKAQVDVRLAELYRLTGQEDEALAAYLDAVMNFPTVYDSYIALIELVNAGYPVDEAQRGVVDYYAGQTRAAQGLDSADQFAAAIAAFERYLAGAPANPARALYYLGLAQRALGTADAAIETWDALIFNYPADDLWDEAWEEKAYTQWAYLDRYADAAQTLENFVALAPAHSRAAEFLFDAGRVRERAGELPAAVALWEQVGAGYPFSGYAYRAVFLAGICQYRLGDYTAAADAFQRSHAYAPGISEQAAAMFWVGKAQRAQNNAAAAQLAWETAAALDPTGYYSERASEILAERQPFGAPEMYDLGIDLAAERAEAEGWLAATFGLPAGDFGGLGTLASDPRMIRGQEYWRLGLVEEARAEFENLRLAVELDPLATYRLANYYYEIGLYRSAIFAARRVLSLAGMDDAATLQAPKFFNHLRFGAYYADIVIPAAQVEGLHPLFVWSVIRQESFFEGFINSPAGARGLMQIIPPTGQALAEQQGWPPDYTAEDLYRPIVSVRLGASYLAGQRDYFGGNVYAALAAYNAGPGNAGIWAALAGSDPDLFLEIIRLEEPRTYIRRIYELYSLYRWLYGRAP